jgi:hypothetical protein
VRCTVRSCDDGRVPGGPHLERIARRIATDGDLFARLAALQAADLRAVLLEVAARRAATLRPADVLRRYETMVILQPSSVDAAAHRRFEASAMAMLPEGFVELLLSPHAPLGASSVLGGFSQDRILTTIADTEVVSDSTNVLALECARRRRDPHVRSDATPTRLAACHQLLRPRDGAHFRLLALCSAGRDRGSFEMQTQALREHLHWHLRVITEHAPWLAVEVLVTDLSAGARRAILDERLLRPIRADWPAINVAFDDDRRAGRNYYTEVCFAVDAVHADGSRSNLSDGGFTEWTARLLTDAKERLLISGLGSERLLGLVETAR